MERFVLLSFLLSVLLVATSCNEDDPLAPAFDVPSTYSFTRDGQSTVNYNGQTERLDMLGEMSDYMKTTRSLGTTVDAQTLKDMFANENAPFAATYAKNLKDKCFAADVAFFESWMERMATASALNQNAAPGQAGHLNEEYPQTGSAASAGYLVDENGIEHHQIIEKGLMGAVFYYQAMERYLTAERMGELGNDETAEDKPYSNMEHYFDEAFGYFGVPIDFPANTDDVRFWGNYCNARNNDAEAFALANINAEIAEAFLTGRAAIAASFGENTDFYTERDAAIETVSHAWERVIAATAADYISRALASDVETYKKHHYLSEAIAFTMSLQYHLENGQSKVARLSNAGQIDQALAILGPETNLWTLTEAQLQEAMALIEGAFPAESL